MVKVKLTEGEHNVSGPEGVMHYIAGDVFEISEQAAEFIKERIEIVSTEIKRGPGRPRKQVQPVAPFIPPKEEPVETVDSVLEETSVEPLSVGDLDLPSQVIAILKDAGYFTLEQFAEETEASLVKIQGIGRARAEQILNAVKAVQD
jgi:DNA-directed RNA polymerase alpha subunit